MRRICLFIMIILAGTLCAQQIKIKVNNSNDKKAYIHALSGEKTTLIDSVITSKTGEFTYNFKKDTGRTGFYRIVFGNNKWIVFLNTGENCEIATDAKNLSDSLKVITSESNKLYYTFIKLNKSYKTKSELLQLIIARYPKDDDFYKTALTKVIQLQDEYLDFVNSTAQKEPDSFIAKYIRSAQLPIVNYSLVIDKQLVYLKEHALDNVSFKDAGLINSDLFTSKTIEYLTYYSNPQLPKELLEKEFIKAVDYILNKAKAKPQVYKHVVEYLIDGFKRFGFDTIIDYIVTNYVIKDDLCLDEKTENSIQRRLDQNRKLPVGETAPNIQLPDATGKEINLAKIKSDKILLMFYASWCPHCKDLTPKIAELYKKQKTKKFEVLAISLDNKKDDWTQFVKENNADWLNVADLKGWDGKAAADYFIYATPTLFLIDKKMKILGKPTTIEELKSCLSK